MSVTMMTVEGFSLLLFDFLFFDLFWTLLLHNPWMQLLPGCCSWARSLYVAGWHFPRPVVECQSESASQVQSTWTFFFDFRPAGPPSGGRGVCGVHLAGTIQRFVDSDTQSLLVAYLIGKDGGGQDKNRTDSRMVGR
jgi:hypothetical protein